MMLIAHAARKTSVLLQYCMRQAFIYAFAYYAQSAQFYPEVFELMMSCASGLINFNMHLLLSGLYDYLQYL